jgi:putative SOS response-associated peptidase YedK
MCGRFTLTCDAEALRAEFGLAEVPVEVKPRYNVAPQQPVLALTGSDARDPRIGFVEWGLVPWWTEGKPGKRLVNVRAESITGRFRKQFERRRCLIPADGFYEWRQEDGRRVPMRLLQPEGRPFALAGIWDRWQPSEEAEPMYTCAIVTTAATGIVRDIHDRMPLIIDPEDRELWLDRDAPAESVAKLLKPYRGKLEAYQVSTLVNSARNDEPACVEPVRE